MSEIKETAGSREAQLVALVKKHLPALRLHSKEGRGALRTSLSRLRFDKRIRFLWLLRMFGDARAVDAALPALIIYAGDSQELDLDSDWPNLELHLTGFPHLEAAMALSNEYEKLTGRSATVVVETIEERSLWKPVLIFGSVVLGLLIALFLARVGVSVIFRNVLRNFS